MEPIVRKIDHVMVPATDPAPLFDLFTKDLGLPAAWPVHDYGMFRSGGVCLGNCNMEIVAGDSSAFEYFEPTLPATARGIAFEPAMTLDAADAALEARGLPHTGPIPFSGQGATANGVLWKNLFLGGMVGRGASAFLYERGAERFPSGKEGAALLDATGGGPLGIVGIEEIFVSVAGYDKAEARWRSFLAPVAPKRPGRWVMPEGPGLRLSEGTRDAVYGLSIRVRSLDNARNALMERKLLGNLKKSSVGLHYPATYGLDIWFVQ